MKTNNILNLIRRNMGGCPRPVKECCYKIRVRPIMEYACAIWDPYTQANIYKLEMVQRRAARFVFQKYRMDVSPSPLINELGWETLAERRARSKAILMYRIQNDLIDIPKDIFQPSNIHFRRSKTVFKIPTCRINCWKYSFVPTTVTGADLGWCWRCLSTS